MEVMVLLFLWGFFGADHWVLWTGFDQTGRRLHFCDPWASTSLDLDRGTWTGVSLGCGAVAGQPNSSLTVHTTSRGMLLLSKLYVIVQL